MVVLKGRTQGATQGGGHRECGVPLSHAHGLASKGESSADTFWHTLEGCSEAGRFAAPL